MSSRTIVPFLALIVSWCIAPSAPATAAAPTAAVLCDAKTDAPEGKLAALLEVKLNASGKVRLLERGAVDAVLREQRLNLLLGSEAGGTRVAVGRQLRANLLVMLRADDECPGETRLVVCETVCGLRLRSAVLRLTGDLEVVSDAVVQMVDDASRRAAEPLREVVAVPPFVNDDLTREHDQRKHIYAKIVETRLADLPGVIVVELDEAQAIAREFTRSAGPDKVARPLPLYILGRYRNAGKGAERTVSLQFEVKRGEKSEMADQSGPLAPDDAAAALRNFTARLADGVLKPGRGSPGATPPGPGDAATEARVLAERANTFLRMGDIDEALNLQCAAMLVQPGELELKLAALRTGLLVVTSKWSSQVLGNESQYTVLRVGRVARNAQDAIAMRREALQLWTDLTPIIEYVINVAFLGDPREKPPMAPEKCRQLIDGFGRFYIGLISFAEFSDPDPIVQAGRRRLRELLYTALSRRRGKVEGPDPRMQDVMDLFSMHPAYYGEPGQDTDQWLIRLLRLAPDPSRIRLTNNGYYVPGDPGRNLKRLRAALDKAGIVMEDSDEKIWRSIEENEQEHDRIYIGSLTEDALLQPSVIGTKGIDVAPIVLTDPDSREPINICKWIAGGKAYDIIASETSVYILSAGNILKRLHTFQKQGSQVTVYWSVGAGDAGRVGVRTLAYDGQYAWAGFVGNPQSVAAIEPDSRKVVTFGEADGLPPTNRGVILTPLDRGRVCVVGCFGADMAALRSWGAILEIKADGRKSIDIIFEAKATPGKDLRKDSMDAAFIPRDLRTVAVGDPKDIANRRCLVYCHILRPLEDDAGGYALINPIDRTFVRRPGYNETLHRPSPLYPVNDIELLVLESNNADLEFMKLEYPDKEPVRVWGILESCNFFPIRTEQGWFGVDMVGGGRKIWFAKDFKDQMRVIGYSPHELSSLLMLSNVYGLVSRSMEGSLKGQATRVTISPHLLNTTPVVATGGKAKVNFTRLPDGRRSYVNSIGMTFVEIPPGEFTMGSPVHEPGRMKNEPEHRVRLTRPFFMATTETTIEQATKILPAHEIASLILSKNADTRLPVVNLDLGTVSRICKGLGLLDGMKYRAPTEAEWEYACRAGSTSAYSFGDDTSRLGEVAVFSQPGKWGSAGSAQPVGRRKPNAWGLYDMHGNVWELCDDGLVPYDNSGVLVVDPKQLFDPAMEVTPTVARGGSWADEPFRLRSAQRRGVEGCRAYTIGFRVVMEDPDAIPLEPAKATVVATPGSHATVSTQPATSGTASPATIATQPKPVATASPPPTINPQAPAPTAAISKPLESRQADAPAMPQQTSKAQPPQSASPAPPPPSPPLPPGVICESLQAKHFPNRVASNVIVLQAPMGEGRKGAVALVCPSPDGWNISGTEWRFSYTRSLTASVMQWVHPWRDGHAVITLEAGGLFVTTPKSWAEIGYSGRNAIELQRGPAWDKSIPVKDDKALAIRSVLFPNGALSVYFDGELVASTTLKEAHPLSLVLQPGVAPPQTSTWAKLEFTGEKPVTVLENGQAMILVGPLDGGIHRATNASLLIPAAKP